MPLLPALKAGKVSTSVLLVAELDEVPRRVQIYGDGLLMLLLGWLSLLLMPLLLRLLVVLRLLTNTLDLSPNVGITERVQAPPGLGIGRTPTQGTENEFIFIEFECYQRTGAPTSLAVSALLGQHPHSLDELGEEEGVLAVWVFATSNEQTTLLGAPDDHGTGALRALVGRGG
jgi:hypothetical protein